jgi:hypothetical protein
MKHYKFSTVIISSACLIFLSGCSKNKTKEIVFDSTNLPSQQELSRISSDFSDTVDIDFTNMSATMVYAEVFNMLIMPEEYEGKTIKAKGLFYVATDPTTNNHYFSVIVQDATACCQEGLEFVWQGEHKFPEDYPPEGSEITVTGRFCKLELEGGITYSFLNANKVEF